MKNNTFLMQYFTFISYIKFFPNKDNIYINTCQKSIMPKEKDINKEELIQKAKGSHKMSFIKNALATETRAAPLALYRMLIGVLFLTSALSKAPWNDFGWFPKAVANNIAHPTFQFWGEFNTFIQQHLTFFGYLQFFLDFFIGLFLILGLLTVITSFFGQFWVLTIWMSVASWPSEWSWTYIMFFMSMFLFWTTKAGRSFGLDQIIQDKVGAYQEHSKFYRFLSYLL